MHIIFAGQAGYPYIRGAAFNRIHLLCKSLEYARINTCVLSRKGLLASNQHKPYKGKNDGVKFIYINGKANRSDNRFTWMINRICGFINEWRFILHRAKQRKLDALFIYTLYSLNVLFYTLLSYIYKFPVILNMVEYRSGFKRKGGFLSSINDWLFDKLIYRFVNGYIPISEFLIGKVIRMNKPYLKIPAICDFESFQYINKIKNTGEKYFLYCGFAAYMEIIHFIIHSFERIQDNEYYLYIVTFGGADRINTVKEIIGSSPKRDFIRIFIDIESSYLINLYTYSKANLIPLRPTIKDIARFPHKIGEYSASRNPIITTKIGEITHYFTDRVNALIANNFNIKEFSQKMQYIINNPQKAKLIGLKGYETGEVHFNYQTYSETLRELILKFKTN